MPRLAGEHWGWSSVILSSGTAFPESQQAEGDGVWGWDRALAPALPQRPRATCACLRGCLQHHWSPQDHPPEYALVQFLVSDPLPISSEALSRLHRNTPCQVLLARVSLQPLTSCLSKSAMPGQGRDAGVTGITCFVLSDLPILPSPRHLKASLLNACCSAEGLPQCSEGAEHHTYQTHLHSGPSPHKPGAPSK